MNAHFSVIKINTDFTKKNIRKEEYQTVANGVIISTAVRVLIM